MKHRYYPNVLNCLIVDADPDSAYELVALLKEIASLSILAQVADASCARQIISQDPTLDIVFFGTGKCNPHAFEIASILQTSIKCKVFIGDSNDSALRAFHAGADSFFKRPLQASVCEGKINSLIASKIQPGRFIASNAQLCIPLRINNSTK